MKDKLNKKLIVYIARSGKKECSYCWIRAFSHRHQIGTLPKDFERLPTAPKPMKRIKKECTCSCHGYKGTQYDCSHCKATSPYESSPKPTKVEKLIEEIEMRGITITMEDISYFPCIESGTWKRFKKEIIDLLSH